jgi:hypothetical protein
MPWGWRGMLYTGFDGQDAGAVARDGTVIAEFCFHCFEDKTWYDVSAVDNCCFNDGIR